MAAKTVAAESNERKVTLVIPRDPGGDEMFFIALNGVAYNIPRGKPVEIPENVAAIYYESLNAEEAGYRYSADEQAKMKVVQGA